MCNGEVICNDVCTEILLASRCFNCVVIIFKYLIIFETSDTKYNYIFI